MIKNALVLAIRGVETAENELPESFKTVCSSELPWSSSRLAEVRAPALALDVPGAQLLWPPEARVGVWNLGAERCSLVSHRKRLSEHRTDIRHLHYEGLSRLLLKGGTFLRRVVPFLLFPLQGF